MKTWYVHRGGRAIGPVTREQIAAAIVAGKVFDDDLFCEVGAQDWTSGDMVPELRELWESDDMIGTAERILADSGAVPLDIDDLEPVRPSLLPALPAPGRPVIGTSATPMPRGRPTPQPKPQPITAPVPVQRSSLGPMGPPPELPPAPVVDEQAPTELFSRETLPPELAPSRPPPRPQKKPRSPDSTMKVQRSDKVHRWTTIIASLVIVAFAVSLTVYALVTHTEPAVVTADPTPRGSLPVPFDALRIGMSRADLEAEFPPAEPLDACAIAMIDDSPPADTRATAHSRCVHVADVAGTTRTELRRIDAAIRDRGDEASRGVLKRGYVRALAQVRGASRAGLVEDRKLLETFGQTGASLPETVYGVSARLAEGTLRFFSERGQQRLIGALLDDQCHGVMPERVSEWMRGELDTRRSRCSRVVGSQQARFAANLLETGGAIATAGMTSDARALQTLRRQSGLDEAHANLLVHLASQADALERFFAGAVVLMADEGAQTTWSFAIAWFDAEGRVSRLLLSVRNGENLERLESFLGPELGHVSSSDPAHVYWDGDGWRARLDHAALALIVEAE